MHNKSIHINKTDNYRIVVISDIHGHADHLRKMLEQVQLADEDYLIILGDFINKGPKVIETFELVMSLKKRKNTFVMKGNHESFMERPIRENDHILEILEMIKDEPYEMIWLEWAKLDGFDIHSCNNADTFRTYVQDKRSEELKALERLPILLHMDEFIFVHGGYEKHLSLIDDDTAFLKFDSYDELATVQEKTVVVGHFPTCILRDDILSNAPYFNKTKNIISIDGGLGVKANGELNALIIEKKEGIISYDVQQVNDFDYVEITQSIPYEQETPIHVKWPDRVIEVLSEGELMSTCLHIASNRNFKVFNELILKENDQTILKMDYANTLLEVDAGERVQLVKEYDQCAMIKYNDVFGWVRRDQIDSPQK